MLLATTSVARALVFATKSVTGAPVFRSRRASPLRVTPLTVLKVPAAYSLVPSGVTATESTSSPPKSGLKPASTNPVSMLYDARPACG